MTGTKWGQHFLVNKNVAEKIVRHFLPAEGCILEVGPGKGVLTDLLLKYGKTNQIKAVELDTTLFYKLRSKYSDIENVEVVNRNILKVKLPNLFPGETQIHLISNVPYYISSEFIDWVISQAKYIKQGILMMQKEFVDKLASGPSSKEYNPQSIIFNYLFRLKKVFDVNPGSFSPQPKVKSTVSLFQDRGEDITRRNRVNVKNFYLFLQLCFKNRRKTLLNNLEKQYQTEKLWEVFEAYGINPKIRAEQLGLADFLNLYRRIHRLAG